MPEGNEDIKTVEDSKANDSTKDDASDDLVNKDTAGFTPEQMEAHLKDLRSENAKKRIAAKKAKEEAEKLASDLQAKNETEKELKAKLEEYEKAKKDAELAEATELEKTKAEIDELRKTIKDSSKNQKKLESELANAKLKVSDKEREAQVDRLVVATGKNFSSTYERDGFINELLKRDEKGEFELNLEETVLRVDEFFKQKKTKPEETPGAGPNDRTVDATLGNELEALLSKDNLSTEETLRLSELSALIAEAEGKSTKR